MTSLNPEVYTETLILNNSEEEFLDESLSPPVISVISHWGQGSIVEICDDKDGNQPWKVTNTDPEHLTLDIQRFFLIREGEITHAETIATDLLTRLFIIAARLPSWDLENTEQCIRTEEEHWAFLGGEDSLSATGGTGGVQRSTAVHLPPWSWKPSLDKTEAITNTASPW